MGKRKLESLLQDHLVPLNALRQCYQADQLSFIYFSRHLTASWFLHICLEAVRLIKKKKNTCSLFYLLSSLATYLSRSFLQFSFPFQLFVQVCLQLCLPIALPQCLTLVKFILTTQTTAKHPLHYTKQRRKIQHDCQQSLTYSVRSLMVCCTTGCCIAQLSVTSHTRRTTLVLSIRTLILALNNSIVWCRKKRDE